MSHDLSQFNENSVVQKDFLGEVRVQANPISSGKVMARKIGTENLTIQHIVFIVVICIYEKNG